MAAKITLKVTVIYNPEKREGFTVTQEHYLAQATLDDGRVINGSGRTYPLALSEIEEAAATALGIKSYDVAYDWNTDGGATGRVNFPAEVEARIVGELERAAKALAARLARQDQLKTVAGAIMQKAPPHGYTWSLHLPQDSYDTGERVWVYANKGGDNICLSVAFKDKNHGDEIWVEGPGWGAERKRCKAGTKKDWAGNAREFVVEYLDRKAAQHNAEVARKHSLNRRDEFAKQLVDGAVADGCPLKDGGDGEIRIGDSWYSNNLEVRDATYTSVSMKASFSVLPEDAKALAVAIANAVLRREARDKAAQEAAKAAEAVKAQG